jgi:hypothetical protein
LPPEDRSSRGFDALERQYWGRVDGQPYDDQGAAAEARPNAHRAAV